MAVINYGGDQMLYYGKLKLVCWTFDVSFSFYVHKTVATCSFSFCWNLYRFL